MDKTQLSLPQSGFYGTWIVEPDGGLICFCISPHSAYIGRWDDDKQIGELNACHRAVAMTKDGKITVQFHDGKQVKHADVPVETAKKHMDAYLDAMVLEARAIAAE